MRKEKNSASVTRSRDCPADSKRVSILLSELIKVQLAKARVFQLTGNWIGAECIYHTHLAIAEKTNDQSNLAECCLSLGYLLAKKGEYPKADVLLTRAKVIFTRLGHQQGLSAALGNLGNLYYYQNDYDQALQFYQQELSIVEQTLESPLVKEDLNPNDWHSICVCTGNIGGVYRHQNKAELAMACYQRQLELAKRINDKLSQFFALFNIGIVFMESGQDRQALEYCQKGLSLAREIGDKRGIANCIGNIGLIFRRSGRYTDAISNFSECLRISEELGDIRGISTSLNNLADCYNHTHRCAEALAIYWRDLAISRQLNDRAGQKMTLKNMAITYQKMGDEPTAEVYFQRAANIPD